MKVRQMNIDCYGCKCDLNSAKILDVLKLAAQKCGAKIIGTAMQEYPEYGITTVVFLAESHILASTYPDTNFAVVEIFLCDDKMNYDLCWEEIKNYLKPESVKINEFFHIMEKPQE